VPQTKTRASRFEASEVYITHFLTRFAQDSGAERVHRIAHSMGNRGLLRSVQRIVSQAQALLPLFPGLVPPSSADFL